MHWTFEIAPHPPADSVLLERGHMYSNEVWAEYYIITLVVEM